jgi:hypothetical protein
MLTIKANSQDQNPAAISCEDLMAAGAPQLLCANLMVTSLMLNAFYAIQQGRLD